VQHRHNQGSVELNPAERQRRNRDWNRGCKDRRGCARLAPDLANQLRIVLPDIRF